MILCVSLQLEYPNILIHGLQMVTVFQERHVNVSYDSERDTDSTKGECVICNPHNHT